MPLPRFLLLRMWNRAFVLLIIGINHATVHCQAGYQVRPPFQTQHVSYPAPRIPLGYQPPPTGALVDQYNNPYDMSNRQPPPAWQSRQPQPLTMIHMPHSQNIQPPVNPQTQFQHQQPLEYFEQPHTVQAVTSKPPEPLVINTLIQVFSRGDSSDSSQQPSTFSLAEAHMITAVKDRNHPESQTVVDGVLSGENRVVLSRQLDTQTRTFVVPSSGGQSSSRRISPENLVAVKAFAATNSTKISASELESELNKELETSIPAIIDELEKVNKSREKATGATPPQAIPLPAGGQQIDEVNIKDLEELVSTALAEVEQNGGWTVTTPSTSTSTTAQPTIAITTMPLIVFTKTSRIFPTTESTSLPSTTTTEWVHSGEKIPEAEGSHEEDKLEDGQRWAPSTPPTGLARTVIVNIPEQEEESASTASATQPAPISTEPSASESTMRVNIPEVESTPQPVPAGTPSTAWTHPNEQGSTSEVVVTTSTNPVNTPLGEMTSQQTEAEILITTETSLIPSSTVATLTEQVSAEGASETTIPTFITTTLSDTQSPELVTTVSEMNLQTTVVGERTTIIQETQTSPTGSAIPESETEVTTGKSTSTFVETTETIQSNPEGTISTTIAAVREGTTAKIAESEDESVPEITATEEEKPQQEVCPNDSAMATLGDNLKGDVLFLLDSSSSVGRDQFRKSVKLIHDTVQQFRNIGPNGIQISLIQYNREPYVEFTFRRHNCLPNALADIADTVFMNGVSNLGRAIEKVMKYAFTKPRGDRPDAENVLVLITDGQSDDEWQIPLELTKVNGTTMLVIATVEANKSDLMMLAADSPRQNFFNLTELTLNLPLSQRLASRIEQILQRSSGTPQPSMIGFGNEVAPEIGEHVDQPPIAVTSVAASITETGSTSLVSEESTTMAVSTSTHASLSDPAIECLSLGIKATFQLPSTFTGSIVANDFSNDPKCVVDVPLTSSDASSGEIARSVSISIESPNCGLHFTKSDFPKGLNQSLVLNIIHDKRLQTSVDRSFVIQCFIPLTSAIAQDHNEPGGENVETDLKILPGVALSKTITLERMPPRCNYSLRRDSPNGAVLQSAAVGQILFHRWECDGGEDSIDVFGILIHDCRASNLSSSSANSAQPYQIIDHNGCSADSSLLGEVVYAEDRLLAYAKAFVFTIKDVDSLRFSCKVSMCLRNGDGCEGYSPPMCNSTNISELLLSSTQHGERMHDSSLESALTGELDSPKLVVMPSPAALAGTNPRHLTQRARRLTTPYLVTMLLIAAVALGSLLGVVCFVLSRRCWPTRKRSPSSLLERANDSDVCSANGAESNSSQRSPVEFQSDLLVDWAGRRITRLGTPPTALRHDRISDAGTKNSDNDEDWKSVTSTVEVVGNTATSEHQRLATLIHQSDAL